MTRQFFAFLALLSGLAALSSPANASVVEVLSCDVGVSVEAGTDTAGVPTVVREATKKHLAKSRATKKPKRLPARDLPRLPVLMGIERAFE